MVTFQFTIDDLVRTRFAISPMWELISSLRALREPGRAALHLPWVTEALPIARALELETALALTPPTGYIPDFLTPPPSTPLASFDDELEQLRRTPVAQIRADLEELVRWHGPSQPVREMLERPRHGVNRLAEVLEQFWRRAVEPHWPRIRSLLEADLAYRSRRLTQGGPAALFEDLHPDVQWSGDQLLVNKHKVCVDDAHLRGEGLLMIPSAFYSDCPASITDPPWQPTLLYPARGLAMLWAPGGNGSAESLAAVIGRTRAMLLDVLDAPRSTTDLAPALELSPGAVSQHLTALRAAGLVTAQRNGRAVLYLRTPTADQLVEAAAQPA